MAMNKQLSFSNTGTNTLHASQMSSQTALIRAYKITYKTKTTCAALAKEINLVYQADVHASGILEFQQ